MRYHPRKRPATHVQATKCPRCGKDIYTLIKSIWGADDTLKKYRGVCSACITPEENREIQNAIAQAALRTVTHGK